MKFSCQGILVPFMSDFHYLVASRKYVEQSIQCEWWATIRNLTFTVRRRNAGQSNRLYHADAGCSGRPYSPPKSIREGQHPVPFWTPPWIVGRFCPESRSSCVHFAVFEDELAQKPKSYARTPSLSRMKHEGDVSRSLQSYSNFHEASLPHPRLGQLSLFVLSLHRFSSF